MSEVGTQKDRLSAPLVERVQAVSLVCWQIRTLKGWAVMGMELSTEASDFTLPRKATIKRRGTRTADRHR